MRTPRPGRRGFTLVELLVVLGLIALLVGILLPTLAGARRRARSAACKAQLQQIGYAFQMYLNHNKNHYPLAPALPSVNPSGYPPLTEYLSRHVDDVKEVFHCPADETLFATEGISYFYYIEVGERPLPDTFFWHVFGNASQVPILWDADKFHGRAEDYNWLFADGHVEDHFVALGP